MITKWFIKMILWVIFVCLDFVFFNMLNYIDFQMLN